MSDEADLAVDIAEAAADVAIEAAATAAEIALSATASIIGAIFGE